jgi:drug/metabolite transporter (DMT)-like permease
MLPSEFESLNSTVIATEPTKIHNRGPLYILIAAVLWSMAGLLIKYIPWHPLAIASGRSFLAALLFLAYYRGRVFRRPNWTTLLSGLALMLTQAGFITANKMTTAANAIMLQYLSPVFIVLIGAIFYHYRPSRQELTALTAALAGIVLFFLDDLSIGNFTGNLIALGTGLTFGLVFLLNSRPECDAPVSIFLGQAATFLIFLPFLLRVESFQPLPVLAVIVLGIFQLGLAYLLFSFGIRTTKPLSANLLAMLEPIANPIWVFLVVGEVPGPLALVGGLIVLAAVTYINVSRIKTAE